MHASDGKMTQDVAAVALASIALSEIYYGGKTMKRSSKKLNVKKQRSKKAARKKKPKTFGKKKR